MKSARCRSTCSGLWLLLANWVLTVYTSGISNVHSEVFYAEFQPDEMVYTSVHIPRYALKMEITIWQEPDSDAFDDAMIFVRYDGLPSIAAALAALAAAFPAAY